jgi:hypothetical protein
MLRKKGGRSAPGEEKRQMRLWFKGGGFRPVKDSVPPCPYGLIEEFVGTHTDTLIYPNVSTCTTLTLLLANDTVVGAHLSALGTVKDVQIICNKMLDLAGASAPVRLGVIGVLRCIAKTDNANGGSAYTSTQEYSELRKLETFAAAFGLPRNQVFYYDQQQLTERNYRVRTVGGHAFLAYYQNVGLVPGGGGMMSEKYSHDNGAWTHLPLLCANDR